MELVPPELHDPITGGLLQGDPVVAEDGLTYARATVEAHLQRQVAAGQPITSPVTGEPMGTKLVASKATAEALERHRQQCRQEGSERAAGDEREWPNPAFSPAGKPQNADIEVCYGLWLS